MFIRTKTTAGGISMICNGCGHAISVNKICEGRIRSATDMLKHMAAHSDSRAFAVAARVIEPEPEETIPSSELASMLSTTPATGDCLELPSLN